MFPNQVFVLNYDYVNKIVFTSRRPLKCSSISLLHLKVESNLPSTARINSLAHQWSVLKGKDGNLVCFVDGRMATLLFKRKDQAVAARGG